MKHLFLSLTFLTLIFSSVAQAAGYKMIVHSADIKYRLSEGFTVEYKIPENIVVNMIAMEDGALFQPHMLMQSYTGEKARWATDQ